MRGRMRALPFPPRSFSTACSRVGAVTSTRPISGLSCRIVHWPSYPRKIVLRDLIADPLDSCGDVLILFQEQWYCHAIGLTAWGSITMAEDHVLTDEELRNALRGLPDWELRDGWLRRTFTTPG